MKQENRNGQCNNEKNTTGMVSVKMKQHNRNGQCKNETREQEWSV